MNRSLELKQQHAYRQMYALAIIGGAVIVLLGTLMTLMYLNF